MYGIGSGADEGFGAAQLLQEWGGGEGGGSESAVVDRPARVRWQFLTQRARAHETHRAAVLTVQEWLAEAAKVEHQPGVNTREPRRSHAESSIPKTCCGSLDTL